MEKDIVKGYIRYLKLQRGMSGNTLDAYQHDLRKLLDYLKGEAEGCSRCNARGSGTFLCRITRHRHQCQKPMPYLEWCKKFLPLFATGRLS